MAAMLSRPQCVKSIYMHVILTLSITIIVLFHHHDYGYFWDLYLHGHSFWTADLGFLKFWFWAT